jgi:hypothetical protein
VAALAVMAAAQASATTPPDTSEPAAPATSEAAAAPTTAGPATATSEEFAALLAAACDGDTGEPLLAVALLDVAAPDGSLRIAAIFEACDVEFVGEIDDEVGRPRTNVESLIADPVNNVTPNQAQLDALNAELAVYWRIADAWARSQQAAAAPSDSEAPTAGEGNAPATTVSEPATTG